MSGESAVVAPAPSALTPETIGVFIRGNGYGGTVKGENGVSTPRNLAPSAPAGWARCSEWFRCYVKTDRP